MRLAILLTCLALPAAAWEFRPLPICTLDNGDDPSVVVTYDGALYAIALTRVGGWPSAPVFSIRFEGPAGNTISTTRHVIDGDTLTVSDTGFGNVLDGIAFNGRGVAMLGDIEMPFDLTGATEPVAAFRACEATPAV